MEEYKKISADVWTVFKKYIPKIPLTDEDWEACIEDMERMYLTVPVNSKHRNYARKYIGICIDELDERSKEARK